MQAFISKYALAAHIAFLAASPLFLFIWVGEAEEIDLTVQVMPLTLQGLTVDWKSGNPDILTVEKTDEYAVHVAAHDDGSLPKSTTLTLTCAGFEKQLTVYVRPAKN